MRKADNKLAQGKQAPSGKKMRPKILIIAGGLAKRMLPVTEEIPKCMIDVGGKPLIQHQIEFFSGSGYKDFVFCLGHLAQKVKDYFGNGEKLGVRIEYSVEEKTMGTAGSAKLAEGKAGDRCIIFYGDNLTSMDFDRLLEFHKSKGSDFTIVMRKLSGKNASSIIKLEEEKVKEFIEHPSEMDYGDENYVNNGIYMMEKKVFSEIPESEFDFGHDLIPKLLEKGYNVCGYPTEEYFRELGRVEKHGKFLEEIKERGKVL